MFLQFVLLEVKCPALSAPTNGGVKTSKGEKAGSVATYTCDKDFTMVGGSLKRTCKVKKDTGSWSGSEPTCEGTPAQFCLSYNCIVLLKLVWYSGSAVITGSHSVTSFLKNFTFFIISLLCAVLHCKTCVDLFFDLLSIINCISYGKTIRIFQS